MRYFLSTLCWLVFIFVGIPSICIVLFPPRIYIYQNDDAARSEIAMLCDAVALYTLHVGEPPTDFNSLFVEPDDLPADAAWQGPYLDRPIPVDPWGNDYRFSLDANSPFTVCIWSCGRDGISGTADDLSSREYENAQAAAGPAIWNPFGGI